MADEKAFASSRRSSIQTMRNFSNIEIINSPIAALGKKTRYVKNILRHVPTETYDRWLEPFAGSCVVGFSEQPMNAIFSDILPYGMQFFLQIQKKIVKAKNVHDIAVKTADEIEHNPHAFKELKERFAKNRDCLDFFLISLFCRNGILQFNNDGSISSSSGRIPKRKILRVEHDILKISEAIKKTWSFHTFPYEVIFDNATKNDIVFADPPSTISTIKDYRPWTDKQQEKFRESCFDLSCPCIVTLWYERNGVKNPEISLWKDKFSIKEVFPVQTSFGKKGSDAVLLKK